MRRALRGAVGTLLVGGVLGLTRSAPAQSPQPIPGRPIATAKTGNEGNGGRPDGRKEVEKMKVELALLADLATFPYYLDGRVAGDHLELHGYVPNNMVRQRALDIARHNTSLPVIDGLRLQAGLDARPARRGAEVLQMEGTGLLRTHLGDSARGIRVQARSDGVVTLTGSINSIEDKLAICKQFHQLAGCTGVIDQLTVRPILHDGQRVVQVRNDGSLTAPPTAAMPKPVQPAARPSGEPVIVSTSKPAPSSLEARGNELRLPTIVTGKSAKSATDAVKHDEATSLKPPAPLMKWGQSTPNQETAKSAEKPSKAATKTSPALAKPVVPWAADAAKKAENDRAVKPPPPVKKWGQSAMSWESQVKPKPGAEVEKPASKPAKKNKPDVFASEHRPAESGSASTGASVALTAPTTPPRWQRPGASEESEPRVEPAPAKGIIVFDEEPVKKPVPPPAPATAAKPPVPRLENQPMPKVSARKPPAAVPPTVERRINQESASSSPRRLTPATVSPLVRLDRPSRWPPAYDIRPAEPKNGHPGLITFDEEPAPVKAATATTRRIVPAELRQRITTVCGRQARDVRVELQRDGSVQVRVRVASSSIGDQLTNKILTIPEMASPHVRLTMDIAP